MALTITRRRPATTHPVATEPTPARVFERPVGTALTGFAALIIGAWAALAGYLGPYFGYRPVAGQVWVNSLQNGLLHLLPGAVGAAMGLMLMAMGPARRTVRGGAFMLPAALLAGAGAWLVIGPVAWPVFHSGPAFTPILSASRNLLNIAGSSYGPGLILVLLAGMALKAGAVPAVPVEDPYTPTTAAPVAERPVAERPAPRTVAPGEVVGERPAEA